MQFKPYSRVMDISEMPPQKLLLSLMKEDEWVVQEKIRGVPFSLWVTPAGVFGANRERFLDRGEFYFNWNQFRAHFEESLQKIRKRSKAKELVVYGDIYGGEYPYPELSEFYKAQPIPFAPLDRGTYYCPYNDFMAYDMVIDGMWQPQWYMYQLFDEIHMTYAFELQRGKLSKVLKFNPRFESEVHELYMLPKIEDNYSGGVIIRPTEPYFLSNGQRVLIKKEPHAGSA